MLRRLFPGSVGQLRFVVRIRFVEELGLYFVFLPAGARGGHSTLVRECRDPKDDKFLELALNGRADLIITGDADLLVLNPWRGIEIVTPREYLTR